MRRPRKRADNQIVVQQGPSGLQGHAEAADGLLTDVDVFEISDPVKMEIRKRELE